MERKTNKRSLTLTPRLNHAAYERAYYKNIAALVKEMTHSFEYWAMAALHKTKIITYDAPIPHDKVGVLSETLQELIDRWDKRFSEDAPNLSQNQLNRLLKYVSGQYKPLLGKDAFVLNKRVKEIVDARYLENVALIKSIPRDLLKRYESTLYDAVTGGDQQAVMNRLKTIEGITLRQAKRIARDQTAKAIEGFNMARQQELGIEYYIWDTANNERVSVGYGGHRQLDELIFRYDTPEAIIDSYGNRGHPAQRVNCQCTSRGVFLQQGQQIKKARVGYVITTV